MRSWNWSDIDTAGRPRKLPARREPRKVDQTEPLATLAGCLRLLNDFQLTSIAYATGIKLATIRRWIDGYVANGRADTVYKVQQALDQATFDQLPTGVVKLPRKGRA